MLIERIGNMTLTKDLLIAMNNLCAGSEIKVLLAVLSHDCTLSTAQMQAATGITKPNNYFRVRRQLLNLGYLTIDDRGMHVNTDKILSDYALLTN
jgi:hypothetical protein